MSFASVGPAAALLTRHPILILKAACLWLLLAASPAQATISVYVNPGAYAGQWAHAEPGGVRNYAPGARTIEVEEGFNFMFVGGFDGFQFNVAADGTVTTGPVSAVGGANILTFNTLTIDIDPGDFAGDWIVSRVTSRLSGPASVVVVPGLTYPTFVGGGNFALFHFALAGDGQVSVTANTDAAEGGNLTLTFNTTEVFVDPGSYAGSWQIPGLDPLRPIVQSIGPDSAILVVGVSYALIPDRPGLNFPVTDPCGITELDFVDFVFTIGCAPVAFQCAGFLPPMDKVVTVHNHRALPLKAELLDDLGFPVSDLDIVAPPVIEVLFSATINDDPVDVTLEALPVGDSSLGNAFTYDQTAERWRFNLSTQNYSSVGTYSISMKTGDVSEYAIDPTCRTSFVIE